MLDKKYNHKQVEDGKYENWKNKGYFASGDLSLKPYAIVIPPPCNWASPFRTCLGYYITRYSN